jgi:hypothetical protein
MNPALTGSVDPEGMDKGMRGRVHAPAGARAEELFAAIEGAETVLLSIIDRECAALRAGRLLAARAIRSRLSEAAALYLDALRAARAALDELEADMPDARARLGARRDTFSALLRIQLAALAAARAVANDDRPMPRLSA